MSFRPLKSENADFLPEEPLGESVLLESANPLRVWQPKSEVVVLGRSQKAEQEINLEATRADAIPIFRRFGGGGCVLLNEHSLCVSIRYHREDLNLDKYLRMSCQAIADFLDEEYEVEATIGTNYDLVTADRKFLGSSLYMPKGYAQYSCVILFDSAAMDGIVQYLTMPSKEPEHRRGRSHEDFLVPLGTLIDDDLETFRHKLETYLVSELELSSDNFEAEV